MKLKYEIDTERLYDMSRWTHILASLDIDTYQYKENIEDIIKDTLKDAPPITGSEGSANYYVNVHPGHNMFMGGVFDCSHCEYKDTIHKEGTKEYCEAPEDFKCPIVGEKYQSCATITVQGDLRDRDVETTKSEYKEFKKFIRKQGWDIIQECKSIKAY